MQIGRHKLVGPEREIELNKHINTMDEDLWKKQEKSRAITCRMRELSGDRRTK